MATLGIILIILGVGLVIGEFFTGSYVLLGFGIAFIIFGIILLATSGSNWFPVNWWLVSIILAIFAGALVFMVIHIRTTYHRQPVTGKEDLKGKIAIVKETLKPEGTVLYGGELWNAISDSGQIKAGEEVTITKVVGLKLVVTKGAPDGNSLAT